MQSIQLWLLALQGKKIAAVPWDRRFHFSG
jgi:hypothetical protein